MGKIGDFIKKNALKNSVAKKFIYESIILLGMAVFYILFYHIIATDAFLRHLPSGEFYKQTIFVIALLFIIYDAGMLFEEWVNHNKLVIFGIILIAIFTSLPLFMKGIAHQQDLNYHLVRIQTMTDAIRSGQFPVRINSGWMDGYGYPNAIFYGNFLLYVPVLFELIGFPLYQAYKIYVFMINLLTASFAYVCTYKVSHNKSLSFASAFAYTAVPFRLSLIYVNEFVGFYSGITFFPLVALALYMIYTMDLASVKERRKASIVLAIAMSGLIGTHLLSTLMAVVVIIVVAVILFKQTLKKSVIITYGIAVLETVGLSCYFIIPFIDYYFFVPTSASDAMTRNASGHIQQSGVNLLQFFGYNISTHVSASRDINGGQILTHNYSIGLAYILVILVLVVLFIIKKMSKGMTLVFGISIAFMWMSSCYFPWDYLTDNIFLFRYLAQVQFAWRYLSIACTGLLLLTGMLAGRYSEFAEYVGIKKELATNVICMILALSCISLCCNYASDYTKDAFIFYFQDESGLETYELIDGEYLLAGTDFEKIDREHNLKCSSNITCDNAMQDGCRYSVSCKSESDNEEWIDIPIFNYKGYTATDSNNNKLVTVNGDNNVVRVIVPAKYSGTVSVDFKEPIYWRISELISIIVALYVAVLFRRQFLK